jgi:hypothetical protein
MNEMSTLKTFTSIISPSALQNLYHLIPKRCKPSNVQIKGIQHITKENEMLTPKCYSQYHKLRFCGKPIKNPPSLGVSYLDLKLKFKSHEI